MDYGECLREGLLRKMKPDLRKASRSLEIAKERLKEAEASFENAIFSGALILSYTSMFHAARGLLFRDGWAEKSHVCVVAYLREKYVKAGKLEQRYLSMFDAGRVERHETLYGLETDISREDTEYALAKAREFLAKISEIIGRPSFPSKGSSTGSPGPTAGP